MQLDTSNLSSKHMSDFSQASQDASRTTPEIPKDKEEVAIKENGNNTAVDGFKKWFENNKANLESEFPGMKLADLKKEAVKKFKVLLRYLLNRIYFIFISLILGCQ